MVDENDDFMVDPGSFISERQDNVLNIPPTAEYAWVLQLIQVRIEEAPISKEFKDKLIKYILPYLNLAGFTCIEKTQVPEFWIGYENFWTTFKLNASTEDQAELSILHKWIREMFLLMLNKSIDGIQMREVFERKQTVDVRQRKDIVSEKVKKFFGKSKVKKVTEETQ